MYKYLDRYLFNVVTHARTHARKSEVWQSEGRRSQQKGGEEGEAIIGPVRLSAQAKRKARARSFSLFLFLPLCTSSPDIYIYLCCPLYRFQKTHARVIEAFENYRDNDTLKQAHTTHTHTSALFLSSCCKKKKLFKKYNKLFSEFNSSCVRGTRNVSCQRHFITIYVCMYIRREIIKTVSFICTLCSNLIFIHISDDFSDVYSAGKDIQQRFRLNRKKYICIIVLKENR